MKSVLIITTIVCATLTLTAYTPIKFNDNKIEVTLMEDYCDGWEDGYCEGWKDVKGSFSICPITPICPIPEIGKDDYRSGYNRGFKAGYRDALK